VARVPATPSTVKRASWPASVTVIPRSLASEPSDVTETAAAAPVLPAVSRRRPSTTDAVTPPLAALIFAAMVPTSSPAAIATSNVFAPLATCSVSAAPAAVSDDDCVRTSARASASTVTANEPFTAAPPAVATIRAVSLEVATGRGVNTPAPRTACSAPRSASSLARIAASPVSRALARSARCCSRSTGRRSTAISAVTIASVSMPDARPVKLSAPTAAYARLSMWRSQMARSSASWCITRVAGTVFTTSPVSSSRKLATHTLATGSSA
jgi:hypothetical protein